MSKILELNLAYDENLEKALKKEDAEFVDFRILSQSLDARGAPRGKKPRYLYKVELIRQGEAFKEHYLQFEELKLKGNKPIIIGAGPCGLFCALRFLEYGIPTIIVERGQEAKTRMKAIAKYWRYGILDQETNVCFGEGGAGLYSDGKLITRIKSPHIQYVMNKFVDFGAPKETAYEANPHLGSNKIRNIISKLSQHLKNGGCEIIYEDRADEYLFESHQVKGVRLKSGKKILSDKLILATGHSAHETFEELVAKKVSMEAKSFAVGVRIEHSRMGIDQIQHGKFCDSPLLGAARYRLSFHNKKSDRGTYSFCMCPGGYVLSSGTKSNGLVSNGMSNFARNSRWSNSALVVSVDKDRDLDNTDVLAGLKFQEKIEIKAYDLSLKHASGKELPAQRVRDFLKDKKSSGEMPKNSCPSQLFWQDMREIFPNFIIDHLKEALLNFNKKMPGFSEGDALLISPETRTSSPLNICRDKESLESLSHQGLFPAGEGAGYAGGITSAAVDGIKVAEAIIQKFKM